MPSGCNSANDNAKQMADAPCDGGTPGGCPTGPVTCASDFQINAPCRIVKANGGSVTITVSELAGQSGGTFSWTTASSKITLSGNTGTNLTVTSLNNISAAKDAEVITITRNAAGCPAVVKTVNVTVAKVTFGPSANQRNGYDNNDTPANHEDDYICIKQSDYTFIDVLIEGGALGTDFDFVCDTPATCTPVAAPASAHFDLRLDAGATNKDHTPLHAKAKCPSATSFTHIDVCVYKERVVEVVVAKIDHPTNPSLQYADSDYAAHAPVANNKLKEGVVKYNITNFRADNGITAIAFASGSGILSYDIAAGGGADFNAINAAMTGTGTKVRVAIIRDMKSYYYLSTAVTAPPATPLPRSNTVLTITASEGSNFLTVGQTYTLKSGATSEQITIISKSGSTVTCNPINQNYPTGASIEFPAGGWGGDPILIREYPVSRDFVKWTVLHEVGHRPQGLSLADIDDDTDFMHFSRTWTDFRLRYCPRIKKYTTGTENQWDSIPRT